MIIYNDFDRFTKIIWGASDTETFTYIKGVKVSYKKLKYLGKRFPEKYFRENASVKVWAWQFSDGEHFFVSTDFDEYINFLSEHKVKAVWFYNAKFDFAQIDYQLLTHTPKYTQSDGKASTPYTFNSLHNDKGGRFSLKIWTPYRHSGKGSRKKCRNEHTHGCTFYDFCNIFGGGLAKLLSEFKVKDFNGVDIRKSKMEYQNVDEFNLKPDDFQYLKNDTMGLYHLIRIANETLKSLTGYEITKAHPDIMTAGGLAKRVLLDYLYKDLTDKRAKLKAFQIDHPLTVEQDKYLRDLHLYNGGCCVLNERYAGRLLKNVKMYRYDVNSEYPFIMSTMPDVYGKGEKMSFEKWQKQSIEFKCTHIAIYIIEFLRGSVKPSKIPVFRNPFTGKYAEKINIDTRFLMFENEFIELEKWYNLDANVERCIVFRIRHNEKYSMFVNTFYDLKNLSKANGEKAKTLFAKLLLNSSYGKLSERIVREKTVREINPQTNAVHLVHTNEFETESNSMLSVIQGALVTSSARVWLLSHIREICKEDVKQNFIYADTDSVHTFCEYDKADPLRLGAFKNEGCFNCIKYIAPKCYFDAIIDEKTSKVKTIEFHSKGISLSVIENDFQTKTGRWRSIDYISKRFSYGEKFQPLAGMNIKGGKALIPIEKYLAKPLDGFEWCGSEYIEE